MVDEAHVEQRRREILAAAAELFDSEGYAATTMEQVAAKAGISKGSVYNYFRSKDDLFSQLFSEALVPAEADVERLMAGPKSTAERIEGVLDFWFAELERYKHLGRLTLEIWATAARQQPDGDLNSLLRRTYDWWLERIARIIQRGIQQGEVPGDVDPAAAASILIGVTDGLLLHVIMGLGAKADEDFLALLKRSVLASMSIRPVSQAAQRNEG